MRAGRVVIVLPVKPLGDALGRLATGLSPVGRRLLQVAMLESVLAACAHSGASGTLVVTADADVVRIAREFGAEPLGDHDPPLGMNPAVRLGLDAASARGDAALVLTADLPLVTGADLGRLLAEAPAGESAVLVPSRDGTGTNAMLLSPPHALDPQLGPGSLERHRVQAATRRLEFREIPIPGLALDIDTPEDLELLRAADRVPSREVVRAAAGEPHGVGSLR